MGLLGSVPAPPGDPRLLKPARAGRAGSSVAWPLVMIVICSGQDGGVVPGSSVWSRSRQIQNFPDFCRNRSSKSRGDPAGFEHDVELHAARENPHGRCLYRPIEAEHAAGGARGERVERCLQALRRVTRKLSAGVEVKSQRTRVRRRERDRQRFGHSQEA